MSDCRFGVSPVNYPDPDPGRSAEVLQSARRSCTRCSGSSFGSQRSRGLL